MLDRHPVIGCELLDDPFTAKASNFKILCLTRMVTQVWSLTRNEFGVSDHPVCGAKVFFAEIFLMPQSPLLTRPHEEGITRDQLQPIFHRG
jgi:hypothetical protein